MIFYHLNETWSNKQIRIILFYKLETHNINLIYCWNTAVIILILCKIKFGNIPCKAIVFWITYNDLRNTQYVHYVCRCFTHNLLCFNGTCDDYKTDQYNNNCRQYYSEFPNCLQLCCVYGWAVIILYTFIGIGTSETYIYVYLFIIIIMTYASSILWTKNSSLQIHTRAQFSESSRYYALGIILISHGSRNSKISDVL